MNYAMLSIDLKFSSLNILHQKMLFGGLHQVCDYDQ
jgi:hypothetical protein